MENYFAYGSNMSPTRISKRLGRDLTGSSAILLNYRLVFDKQSEEGGKANIRASPGSVVEGIIYEVYENDLLKLDYYEGVHTAQYSRIYIMVTNASGKSWTAVTYQALNTGPETPPSREYLNFLLEGKPFLSSHYYIELNNITTL